ncbi:65_t:CDS:10, partial [Paraglomus brasilianum]
DGNETEIEVNFEDVIAEFNGIRSKYQIRKWAAKPVTRKYAFELPNIPSETEYLKVVYSFSQPQLPNNLTGETFSHMFGTNTSALELFLIKRKVMGPCWLEIKNATPTDTNISWCKTEIIVEDPKDIDILKDTNDSAYQNPPPVTIMCFSLRTVMNPTKKVNEIVIASALVFRNVPIDTADPPEKIPSTYFTVVRQLNNTPYPVGFHDNAQHLGIKLEITRTERSLLNYLIAIIHRVDPDVLVGHNFVGFDLDVLLHRMKELKIDGWSKLGRLRRTTWPKLQTGAGGMGDSTYMEKAIVSGRLMCDTYLNARDLIKSKNYTLTELASSQLKFKREDIEFSKINTYFQTSANLFHVIKHCESDAYLAAGLTFRLQILPLSKQLTNLAGNTWARTLIGGRAERNESLLLHEFHRNKYICPDKAYTNIKNKHSDFGVDDHDQSIKKSGRRKPAYAGGLVLEPKKGFYDKFVLLLDFNSLYPSIIQEYNICFTTISRDGTDNEERVPDIPDSGLPQGILPKLLASLVDRRRQVKRLLKDPHIAESVRMQYDIRQQALKLTANSMYGCLGFTFSRFYAKSLAMLITSKGREILQNTVDLAESERMEVIYGDTDSIMIYTNEMDLKKVREMGNLLKRKVNERYKLLEIEMDGFFRRMLLLKKKKYAALIVEEKNGVLETSIETKGLDLVRRDWCGLSHDASKYVLEQLLSPDDREDVLNRIHKFLTTLADETRLGRIPTDKFVINKNLTKAPEDYADAQNQPHVQVALQMKKMGLGIRTGDTIPYVICAGEEFKETKIIADRARHPNDISSSDTLKIVDYEWYLNQQVHPAVARLCEPIEGTDAVQIARSLGLDTSKFRASIGSGSAVAELYTLDSQISDEERFVNADRFKPICRYCQGQSIFEGVNSKSEGYILSPSGILCPNSECSQALPIASLIAQLSCQIRWHITKYYEGWLVCDDEACRNRTRLMHGKRCLHPGCRGTAVAEYSDTLLYEQLLYLSTLFDVDKALNSKKRVIEDQTKTMIEQNRHLFVPLKKVVDGYLDRCGRRFVDLNQLFAFCQA